MSAGMKLVATRSLLCSLLALAACKSTEPVATDAAPVAPALTPPAPGVVGTVIGQALDPADKEVAIAAQQQAVTSGARKTWRGAHGSYGFIEPEPENALSNGCRDYLHKIFIDGRPQQAKGRACKQPDGSWRLTG
jgi:surface antigen